MSAEADALYLAEQNSEKGMDVELMSSEEPVIPVVVLNTVNQIVTESGDGGGRSISYEKGRGIRSAEGELTAGFFVTAPQKMSRLF